MIGAHPWLGFLLVAGVVAFILLLVWLASRRETEAPDDFDGGWNQ